MVCFGRTKEKEIISSSHRLSSSLTSLVVSIYNNLWKEKEKEKEKELFFFYTHTYISSGEEGGKNDESIIMRRRRRRQHHHHRRCHQSPRLIKLVLVVMMCAILLARRSVFASSAFGDDETGSTRPEALKATSKTTTTTTPRKNDGERKERRERSVARDDDDFDGGDDDDDDDAVARPQREEEEEEEEEEKEKKEVKDIGGGDPEEGVTTGPKIDDNAEEDAEEDAEEEEEKGALPTIHERDETTALPREEEEKEREAQESDALSMDLSRESGETDDTATTSTSTVTETEEERGTVISEIEADEKLSKYDALMKEEEEKEEAMKQNASTEETEQNSPPEIEELPSLDEEQKEEKNTPPQKPVDVFGGKSETNDPLYKGGDASEKEEEQVKEEDAPMQEADALSVDFTADDATATDQVEQKKEVVVEETPTPREETPASAETAEEEKIVEEEQVPTKEEKEKDWDKAHEMYDAILKASKNKEKKVSNAVANVDKVDNDATASNATLIKEEEEGEEEENKNAKRTAKVLGGNPKSLGVVSASPLTNPSLSFAAFRFSKRLGYAFARPGKCICAGSCECAGACGSSMESLEKQSTALKDAGVDAGVSVISDASLVYNNDLNLERWIGEVADPAVYGLERLYAAVEHYISTDVENEEATMYAIMNKSPYPELAKCDVFDVMFSQLREDRKNGKTVKVNVDAKDEAKLAVLTACDGFVNNPQATKFGGGTSAKEIGERFDAIIPADSGLDGLISLTFMSGFAISDLAYGANDENSKQNKMKKEIGISVDLATEPDAVLKRLRDSNKLDEELYKQSTKWLDGVKEAHRKAFNAHKAIVEVWIEESDQYCESPSSKKCIQEGSSSTTTTTDQFMDLLGSFPESCKASDPKTRSCVDDWWECEGPGSEGSAFAGQFGKTSAAASSSSTMSTAGGDNSSGGKNKASAVEALSNFKYKVMYDREHPLNKAAQFGAQHSKKFARGTMNAVNVGAGHAVANFKKIPTGVHASVAIIFIFSLFGYYTYVQYKSLRPVSSLELNTSSVKVLKAFEDREKALKGISNIPAGELMRDDAFWGGGLSQSEMERGTAGRGSSRVSGGKRRTKRGSNKNRGPMTEEELNFYEDLSD